MTKSHTRWAKLKNAQLIESGILEIGDGYRAKNSEMGFVGLPFVRAGNIDDGFHFEDIDILDESRISKAGSKISRVNDIVFTSKGTVGRFAFVKPETPKFVYSPQLCYWRIKDVSILEPHYLFYWMRSRDFINQVHKVKGLTDMADYVSLSDQRKMIITAPPLHTQHKIAAILSAYDDLIENNTRRIAILEEMAQSLYREWFVQFRFPGHEEKSMVESTLGMIPEGWEVVKFIKIAELSRDNINPGKFEFEKFAHYSLPAFDEGCMPVIEYGQSIKSNKFLVREGSVLLSKLNPRIPRVWLPMLTLSERAIASTEFMVFVPKRSYTREMLYCCCQSTEFMDRFAGRSGGTSTSHQRVKPEDLLNLPIVLPESSIVDAFTEITSPMFKVIHNMRLKIVNLRRTRDLLLPRLISGEIDVEGLKIETGEEMRASVVSTEEDVKNERAVLVGEQGTLWG